MVTVTGPGGFKDNGRLPWDAVGLASGTYQVKITRRGYGEDDETMEVSPGTQAAVRVKLVNTATEALPMSEQSSTSHSEYTINGDTVYDRGTQLTWQREVPDTRLNWRDAKAHCANLNLGRFSFGWRLPTEYELMTIVDKRAHSATIDRVAFPNTKAFWFWTNTIYVDNSSYAWVVGFGAGNSDARDIGAAHYVRCVR